MIRFFSSSMSSSLIFSSPPLTSSSAPPRVGAFSFFPFSLFHSTFFCSFSSILFLSCPHSHLRLNTHPTSGSLGSYLKGLTPTASLFSHVQPSPLPLGGVSSLTTAPSPFQAPIIAISYRHLSHHSPLSPPPAAPSPPGSSTSRHAPPTSWSRRFLS